MKFFLAISVFLICQFAVAQTVQSTCNFSDSIAYKYKKDADRLAIRRVYHINSPYQDTIKVNKAISEMYLKALIAVYNATALPARDTAIRVLNIHTNELPDVNSFYLVADSNLIWMKNLRNSVSPTGDALVDNTISKYSCLVTQYTSYSQNNAIVTLHADTNINTLPLVNQFYLHPGVMYFGPQCCVWDGPDIYDTINPSFIELDYTYKWQDCIDGCDKIHWWAFRVYNDCSVSYEGSQGNALPAGVGIKENAEVFRNLKVYPNPVVDLLTIELADAAEQVDKVSITDVLGQTVWEIAHPPAKYEVDTRFLPSGVYFLKVENATGVRVVKILKE